MTTWYYVRPTDTIFVRGNLAFGEGGEHGAGVMPPQPSVFAGAFRSAILGRDAEQLGSFVNHGRASDADLHASLGTPSQPGNFRLHWLSLAGEQHAAAGPRDTAQTGPIEALLPLPADLVWLGEGGAAGLACLLPKALPEGVQSGGSLPLRATLQTARHDKATGGRYMHQASMQQHLHGELPARADACIEARHVHKRDSRLGIGLNTDSRSVEDGLIYTTEGHAFSPAVDADAGGGQATRARFASTGFLVGIAGADGLLARTGHVRLGGDGRGAQYTQVEFKPPKVDPAAIATSRCFRVILRTAAVFPHGWLPAGVQAEAAAAGQPPTHRLTGPGFSARLVCAAVGRREVISGWDLHQWRPKPAEAAAPAGSVYWFDEFEGDAGKLAAWVDLGLRADTGSPGTRHAEGFGQAWLALWPQGASA